MAYAYWASITIAHGKVPSNQSNVPVVISGTYAGATGAPDLRTTANGGNIQNTVATGGASGSLTVPADFDICTDKDNPGTTGLDFEFEKYSATTGEVVIHVEVDSLSSSANTVIYIVYGDSGVTTSQENVAGTWGNSYAGVWHLGGQLYDSSGGTGTLTNSGATGSSSGGPISGYYEFGGGEEDYLQVETAAVTGTPTTFTAWGRATNLTNWFPIVSVLDKSETTYLLWLMMRGDKDDKVEVLHHNYGGADYYDTYTTTTYSADTWHHCVARFASDNERNAYIDGGNKGTDTGSATTPSGHDRTSIGAIRRSTSPLHAAADLRVAEVRISSVARTDDWIEVQYNTQSDPSTFYTMGSETSFADTTIALAWQDNSESEDGFELQRRASGGTFATVTAAIAANAESYNDTGVPVGYTYEYRLRALSAALGNSEWSNIASETV